MRKALTPAHLRARSPAVAFLETLSASQTPVVQAGMGGGLSRHELAAAVSEAGGWGRSRSTAPEAIERELAAARALTGSTARGQPAAALRPARLVRGGRGRRRGRHLLGHAEAAHRRHLDPPVRLGRGGARRPRGRRRRGDRPGRRGRRPRARHRAGAGAARAGRGRRCPPTTRCCSPAGSPSARRSAGPGGGAERAPSPAPASCSPRRAAPIPSYRRAPAGRRRDDPHRALRPRLAGAPPGRPPTPRPSTTSSRRDPRGPCPEPSPQPPHRAPAPATCPPRSSGASIRAQRPGSRLLTPPGPTDDGPAHPASTPGPLYAGETVARIDDVRPAAEIVAT